MKYIQMELAISSEHAPKSTSRKLVVLATVVLLCSILLLVLGCAVDHASLELDGLKPVVSLTNLNSIPFP